ncbi:hypothetical protein BJ138DRAFT_670798 [Hygrophoropsis aurantiaca]|uniref:Uncharacterized protein n=1 Tax=Hygrophoropsis aurantiaca TaxID=72124 RepID=A0ACB7ZZJ6_9AGAM|nr:hypothetical protein BJ138DRAFT_670798 [Hygrophoropsis aurantiaca]
MHRALLIYDILRHIFEYFAIYLDSSDDLQTPDHKLMAHLARTCRSFHEPAIDILWADLDSIHPLIQCLLSDGDDWMCNLESDESRSCKNMLLLRHEFTFHKYASRVRILRISMDMDTFQALVAFGASCRGVPGPQPATLCPHLIHLEWSEINPEMLPHLHLFLSPSLLVLKLDLWRIGNTDLRALSSLSTFCPSVRTAIFEGPFETDELSAAVSRAVCGWRDIRELRCGSLDQEVWEHLSATGRLTSADFRLPPPLAEYITRTSPSSSDAECTASRLFPEMLDICVSCPTVSLATGFLDLLHHTPRRFHLTAESTYACTAQAIHALFAALSVRALDSYPPTHLKLYGSDQRRNSDRGSLPPPVITLVTLQPLLSFKGLRVLHIDSVGTFSLDDVALHALAAAWPNLETLWLHHTKWPHPLGITFRGLAWLIGLCPCLEQLALAFDVTDADSGFLEDEEFKALGGASGSIANHAIHVLYALNSSVRGAWLWRDAARVAVLLRRLFPRLEKVLGSAFRLWEDVNIHLPVLRDD